MKRYLAALLIILTALSGCSSDDDSVNDGLVLRKLLLSSNGCSFKAAVTADYGDRLYTFCVDCVADSNGKLTFTVAEPESIKGISGIVAQEHSALTFDDEVLAFPKLIDDELSPVSAPWILINSLRSGYITACGNTDAGFELLLNDSYDEESMQLQVYTDIDHKPYYCEILWQGHRVLSMKVSDFEFL